MIASLVNRLIPPMFLHNTKQYIIYIFDKYKLHTLSYKRHAYITNTNLETLRFINKCEKAPFLHLVDIDDIR